MADIKRFEDIPVWRNARELVGLVYRLTRKGDFRRDFGLRDQIQRSAVSVMSNIAEGFESQSDRHFISYLFRARASAGELRCHLYVAFDQRYITETECEQPLQRSSEISRMIAGFVAYLQSSNRTKEEPDCNLADSDFRFAICDFSLKAAPSLFF